jgi:hypothetical protein
MIFANLSYDKLIRLILNYKKNIAERGFDPPTFEL